MWCNFHTNTDPQSETKFEKKLKLNDLEKARFEIGVPRSIGQFKVRYTTVAVPGTEVAEPVESTRKSKSLRYVTSHTKNQ